MRRMTYPAFRLLHDGVKAMAAIEHAGVKIDTEYLARAKAETTEKIGAVEDAMRKDEVWKAWAKAFGAKANLGSAPQLGEVLFKVMKYEAKNLTATGRPSTKEDDLQELADDKDIPFLNDYLRWRKLHKVRDTFLAQIEREVCDDGFVHPNISYHLTRSFRTQQSDPNLQNMPIRNPEFSKVIRSCFVSRWKGGHIVEVDFSGIEVRVAACFHKDPAMIRYIKDKSTDMHRDMAMGCYKLRQDEVSKQSRYCAKNQFVFPQFYGSYYLDCARALWKSIRKMRLKTEDGISLKVHLAKKGIKSPGAFDRDSPPKPYTFEAHIKEVERRFWKERFPVYDNWKKKWFQAYEDRGYFVSKVGFVYSEYYRRNQVNNLAIQGDAGHCLVKSVVKIQKEMCARRMKAKVWNIVHDSVVADVPADELDTYCAICDEVMTKWLPDQWPWIIVPLEIETEVSPAGGAWADKKEYDAYEGDINLED